MFRDLNSVKTINFNNLLNSCYSTTFYWLFCRDFELQSIDLSGFDTSRINHISAMFEQCKKLVSVDLSNLNTSRVRDFSYLFSTCLKLTSVDLSGFDFSSATSFYRMFALCEKLTTIYCNSDFKKLINISTFSPVGGDDIFKDCYLLPGYVSGNTNIDYANPDTGYFTPNYMKNLNNVFTSDEKSSITSVTFTNNVLDNNYTFVSDIDQLNSGSIKLYRKNNDIYITSSDKIYFPPESSRMFENFTNVVNYNFDNISTIRVINFGLMFSKNKKITSLDVSKFDTRNATNMIYMFDAMSLLSSLDISNFDTSNVTNFGHMFSYDVSLETLNLGNMNTSSAEIMSQMFYDLRKLVTLDISSFDVSKVTNFKEMFVHCISLTTIYCDSDWSSRSSSLVTDGDLDMFKECSLLSNYSESNVNINYANANTGYFTGRTMKNLYNSYTSDTNSILYDTLVNATSIEFTSSVLDGSYTFKDNLDSKNKGSIKLYSKGTNLYIYSNDKVYFPENSKSLFRDLNELTKINFNNLIDTSHVTNMSSLFRDCPNLLSLDLRSFDTSNVTLMSDMFVSCLKLASINLSSFDTSNVTSMDYMFTYCSSLTNLDISSFKATNVSSTRHMFYNDQNLVSLDMSNFNTNSLKDANGMFAYCSKLTSLDISSFNTSNVLTMYEIFKGCTLLEKIYVSNKFIVSNLVDNYNHNGTIENGKADIFTDSLNLVGGSGTVYNSSYTDSSYAVVDMAYYDESGSIVSGTPGYLTLRNIIPNNYERVSYIETSKTQYITTDITIGDIKDKYTMDIEFEALSLYDYNTLWGSTLNEDTYEGWIYGSGGPRSRSNDLYIDKRNVDIKLSLNTKHRYSTFVESNTTSFSLLDKNLNYSDVFDSRGNSIASLSKNILLFKSGTDYSHLKVYSFRIISNDVIIGDFVPVKRKSDGIYGMYDTVRNKFYKSEGTSEFIGPSE